MRGRNDSRVDADGLRTSQPLDLFLLEHPEQLDLNVRGEVADLVEKDRRVVGHLEAANLPRQRACIGAFFAAEQLTFHERRRNRRAVHAHHGTAVAAAQLVDLAREHLLAAAGLAEQQYRRIGRGDLLHLLLNAADSGTLADDDARASSVLDGAPKVDVLGLRSVPQL